MSVYKQMEAMNIHEFNTWLSTRYFCPSEQGYVLFFQPTSMGVLTGGMLTYIKGNTTPWGSEYRLRQQDNLLFISYAGTEYEITNIQMGESGVSSFCLFMGEEPRVCFSRMNELPVI